MRPTAFMVWLLISLAAAAGAAAEQQPSGKTMDPAVKKDGWWVRIAPDPKVDVLTLQISRTDKPAEKPAVVTWTRGNDPDNFDLPESVRLAHNLRVVISARPGGASSSFCLFYAENGVKLVTVPGASSLALDAKGREKGCTP
jgi:hypothetical protein